ncbi:MAG: molybdopterin-synthase adenylyltransferase MoeB [Flavobacteriaceae bacterium]|nr:molybdopterin-synthase adenylyltransferase MoeB [Flavobacteriaceae bacterium]
MERYSRHIILSEIGQEGQDKLNLAKVLVVGAGGLGCPVLQYLAGAGIGTIGIIDFDVVSKSNLQRQVLFGTSTLGENKAIAAKQRLEDLNDSIIINAYPEKLTHQNATSLFSEYDIIVDGTDNFETRYLINDASIITKKPLVFGGIYKFEGQISVFNYNNGPSYRCLFPNPPEAGSVPNCSEIGVLGVLPGIIGSMQANEVLKIILALGQNLSGKLLCYNALTLQSSIIKIKKSENEINKVLEKSETFQLQNQPINTCNPMSIFVSIQDIFQEENIQFIDVRETHELPKVNELDITSIPLSELENQVSKLDSDKKKVLFCQAGIRSRSAVLFLQQQNIENCFSLIEGASGINSFISQHKKN